MKKLLSASLIGILLTTSSISALASETTEVATDEVTIEVNAGITPDRPLYQLDRGWENFRIWLAKGNKESELKLKYAEERLAELNDLDEEDVDKYADDLIEDYGNKLEQVNLRLSNKLAQGKANERLQKVRERLGHLADAERAVNEDRINKVSTEMKEKMNQIRNQSYVIAIASELEQTEIESLKEQGFGYGEIIKLKAISDLSGKTIEELLLLDVFVINEDDEREVDFGKLAIEIGLVKTDEAGEIILDEEGNPIPDMQGIQSQFKQYKDTIVEVRKEQNRLAKEIIGLKKAEQAQKRAQREEAMEQRKAEARQLFQERLNERFEERVDHMIARIEAIYTSKVEIIQTLDLTDEEKTTLINELDLVKAELSQLIQEKVTSGEISPNDYGQMNREISQGFNQVLEDLELSEEEQEAIEEQLDDPTLQIENLTNQFIRRYEMRHQITLTEEQEDTIHEAIENLLADIQNETDPTLKQSKIQEFISNLRETVVTLIEDLDSTEA